MTDAQIARKLQTAQRRIRALETALEPFVNARNALTAQQEMENDVTITVGVADLRQASITFYGTESST